MCGIFGIVEFQTSAQPSKAKLLASAHALAHRGPDAQNIHAAPGLGLAHTRLSFLDIDARSNQPMWDESGRYVLVYNGEIYNYKSLREELETLGVNFRTSSDTEVLLHALIHNRAEDILPRLEGMFGFGLYDTQDKTLLLARDRFGMKPVLYRAATDHFAFCSEIKALAPWMELRPDPYMLSSYLLNFGGPTQGHTGYEGIRALAPGRFLRVNSAGDMTEQSFFRLPDYLDRGLMEKYDAMTPSQMVDCLDDMLTRSVSEHMFADVPVGAFCSGGVDSSLLMAKAAKSYNNLAIFHANVKGQWSELGAAQKLAQHLNLDLQCVDVEDQDFVDLLPRVMKHYEFPFSYHPNCAPLMMIARLARDKGVKGLLSGEGADECFLGYPWLGRKSLTETYYKIGTFVRSQVHKIPEIGRIAWPDQGNRLEIVRGLLNRGEIDDDEKYVREKIEAMGRPKIPDETAWTLDYLNYHLRTLLHRNDTMGMEASIEARFPLLDNEVVRVAVNMPPKYKLRASLRANDKAHPFVQDKWVMREVAKRHVPRDLSHRNKLGFWTTVFRRLDIDPQYFNGSYVQETLGLTSSQFEDLFARADDDLRVRLLHLDVWGQVFFQQVPEDESVSKLRAHTSIRSELRRLGN